MTRLIILAFIWCQVSHLDAQYLETFAGQNGRGLVNAICPAGTTDISNCGSSCPANVADNTTTCVTAPPIFSNWSILKGPATAYFTDPGGTGFEFDSPDDFGVVSDRLQVQDTDNEICWYSPVLNISASGAVSISVDVSQSGGLEAGDYVLAEYSLDNGPYVSFGNQSGAFVSTVLNVSGLTGATLQIRICATTDEAGENIFIDNIAVPQSGVGAICTPLLFNVTGNGLYCPGSIGIPVGLDGSQVGVNYQLFLGTDPVGLSVSGTGNAIFFGDHAVAGNYTVVATNVFSTGCTATMTGSAALSANASPVHSAAALNPTSCFGADGSITLTLFSGAAPFTFNWFTPNGCGIVPGQQNQSGLCVGTYSLVITGSNGCTAAQFFDLAVPGVVCNGCSTLGSVTVAPNPICAGSNTTMTAVGGLPGASYTWYDMQTGGNQVGTGNPFTTGPLAATTTYCVDQTVNIPVKTTFDLTGAVQNFVVPAGVTSLNIQAYGADGGHADFIAFSGGKGGTAIGNLAVVPGQILQVYVGGRGGLLFGQGGYNGGGKGGVGFNQFTWGGGGGGASDVRIGAGTLAERVIVAAGGGGGGSRGGVGVGYDGGPGGGLSGSDGGMGINSFDGPGGGGGTQASGGNGGMAQSGTPSGPGFLGSGGDAATINNLGPGGGGGGGYYGGGGGGGGGLGSSAGGGGGGGSSYIGGVFNAYTSFSGVGIGDGKIIFSYALPCTSARVCGTVLVNPTPDAVATPPAQTICSGNNITTIALSGSVVNTTFNWTRDNNATVTGIASSGSGNISGALTNTGNTPVTVTFTITPSTTDCPGVPITATVLVNPVPQVFAVTGGGVVCTTDNIGVPVGLSGSQTNVNYQLRLNGNPVGAPVAGTGAAISFGPQVAVGTYTAVATHTQGACTATMSASAAISAVNCNIVVSDPCICLNNATTLSNGQFDEVIRITATTGQTWTASAVNGFYSLASLPPPSTPTLVTIGTPFVETPAGSGIYLLSGRHVDALGYNLSATNARGTTLSIGNTCAYPNPAITSDLSGPFCLYSNAVTLTGNPGDANLALSGPTQVFTVNGAVTNSFNPAAGVGPYSIEYTVYGGAPKAFGAADPGCIQSVSQTVNVVATPSNLVCNDLVNISLDESCGLVLSADQILEGSYACFDDYVVEIDRTLPLGNGPWQPGILNAADIDKTYAVQVVHLISGNSCWGNIYVEDKLPPVFENCGCIPTPVTQFTGSIDNNDPVFIRPNPGLSCSNSFNTVFYDAITIQVNVAGSYTFAQFADGGDGFGVLYSGSFDPMNPCQNFLEADDDDNVTPPASQGDDFLLTRTLTPGTYVLVVTTFGGNAAYGSYTVSVTGPPGGITDGDNCTFRCADKDGLLDGSIAAPTPLAVDNCSNVTLTKNDVFEEGAPCGDSYIYRTWTASDAWGNTSQCTQVLTLTPYTLAEVMLPDDLTIDCAGCGVSINTTPCGLNSIPRVEGNDLDGFYTLINCATGFEGLCNLGASYEDTRIDVCVGTFKILRRWTIVDWCTNEVLYHDQLIKVADEIGPDITVPADMTVSTNPTQCCATIDLPDVIIEDICSPTATISAMIQVYDQYLPDQLIATYTLNKITNPGQFGLTDFTGNNYWDCDTLGRYGVTPCLPIGRHLVTYMAEDVCGNTSAKTFWITVQDYIPPIVTCTEFTTVSIGQDDPTDCYEPNGDCEFAGVTWVPASAFNQGSYDNCNDIFFTIQRMAPYSDCIGDLNPINGFPDCNDAFPDFPSEYERAVSENDSIKFYCCEVGTTQTVILRAYQIDINGNIMLGPDDLPIYNECMIQVEVQDKIKPACVPPANVTVACENFEPSLWAYGYPEVSDNCCLDTFPPTSASPQGVLNILPGTTAIPGVCGATQKTYYNGFLNANFDTTCNRGIIIRRFTAWDCYGQSSSCTQRITVTNVQDYNIEFPADKTVDCVTEPDFGYPIITNDEGCELIGISYNDVYFTVVPDACYKIERTWTVINWCTYVPDLPCYEHPRANGRFVRVWDGPAYPGGPNAPDNCVTYKQVIKVIDQTPPTITCAPIDTCDYSSNFDADGLRYWNDGDLWWDNGTQSHNLCETDKTLLSITAADLCDSISPVGGLRFRYLLFLDLDGDGVMETVISSADAATRPFGRVRFNNYQNPNYGGGNLRRFDLSGNPFAFNIEQTATGARVIWRTAGGIVQNPNLPHGTHKIKWIAEDGCGNEAVCERVFTIRDCKAPTVACADVNINLMFGGLATLWANDFFLYGEDNCTPVDILESTVAIVRADDPNYDHMNYPAGSPQSIVVTCDDQGMNVPVEVWLIDAAGNADFCTAYINVQANIVSCNTAGMATVAGQLATENAQGVEDAMIELATVSPAGQVALLTQQSDDTGSFQFLNAVPMSGDYTLTPTKDDNPLNGVTTYDLVLISKHILGLEPLNSPYKMIAADANRSGSITTFDIVEFRKLILGIYNELPNNTSWRFVDKSFLFPEPTNPFQTIFPENIAVQNVQADRLAEDFVGIKIGDVNNTVIANSLLTVEDRTAATMLFDVEDRVVKAGEVFTLNFKGAERVQGYQFTMNLNGLEVVDIVPGTDIKLDNFAVFAGAITTSVDGAANEFAVTFRATHAGRINQMLSVSSRITKAEAYNLTNNRLDIAFRFNSPAGMTISGVGFELYQNQPNPFMNKTCIGFHLPEATQARLSIFDETGRMVFTQNGEFAKGYNAFAIDRQLITTTGVLYYTVETATDSATKKMIQSK